MSMSSLLDLLRIVCDEGRASHERTQAGRTLANHLLRRCQEIDKLEIERARARVKREADSYANRGRGIA